METTTFLTQLSHEVDYKRSFLCVIASSFVYLCDKNVADMGDLEKLRAAVKSYDNACESFINAAKVRI